jgi:hypothetical protein
MRQRWAQPDEAIEAWINGTEDHRRRLAEKIDGQLQAMGLVNVATAAAAVLYSPSAIRDAAVRERSGVPVRRRPPAKYVDVTTDSGLVVRRIASEPFALGHWYEGRFGTKDAYRRLAPVFSRLKGTVMGRPAALIEDELARVLELRAADPEYWGYRRLAKAVNQKRGPDAKQVSHMAVKHALEREGCNES